MARVIWSIAYVYRCGYPHTKLSRNKHFFFFNLKHYFYNLYRLIRLKCFSKHDEYFLKCQNILNSDSFTFHLFSYDYKLCFSSTFYLNLFFRSYSFDQPKYLHWYSYWFDDHLFFWCYDDICNTKCYTSFMLRYESSNLIKCVCFKWWRIAWSLKKQFYFYFK